MRPLYSRLLPACVFNNDTDIGSVGFQRISMTVKVARSLINSYDAVYIAHIKLLRIPLQQSFSFALFFSSKSISYLTMMLGKFFALSLIVLLTEYAVISSVSGRGISPSQDEAHNEPTIIEDLIGRAYLFVDLKVLPSL